jgi:mRNA interferase MazF
VPFPFSDLTRAKRRPALVLAALDGDDAILCQITSRPLRDRYPVAVTDKDFLAGSLRQSSNARPNRLFTCDRRIILYKVGSLGPSKLDEVVRAAVSILQET